MHHKWNPHKDRKRAKICLTNLIMYYFSKGNLMMGYVLNAVCNIMVTEESSSKLKMRVVDGTIYWILNNQISYGTELTWVVSVSVLLWFSPQAHHTSKQFLWTLSWQIHIWYIAYPQLLYPALGVLETAVRIVPTSKAWNDSKIRSTAWGSFASAQFSSIVIHSFYYHLSIWTAETYFCRFK